MLRRHRNLAVPAVLAGAALFASACSLLEPAQEAPRSPRRIVLDHQKELEPDTVELDRRTPPSELTEETLASPAPTLPAAAEMPTPTAAESSNPAAAASPAGPGGPVPAFTPAANRGNASADSESVLGLIGPATPPQVSAAFRMVEEGRGLLDQQQFDRAEERFERAVAVDPSNVQGYYFLAKAHYATKQYYQAEGFVSRAIALGARTDPAWQARCFALLGSIYESVGRYPEARQAYQNALRVDPRNTAAQGGLGRLNAQ